MGKEWNLEGQIVFDFAKRIKETGWHKSGGRNTRSDYILFRVCNINAIRNGKVVTRESAARHHWTVVCRMNLDFQEESKAGAELQVRKEDCCEDFREKMRTTSQVTGLLQEQWSLRQVGRCLVCRLDGGQMIRRLSDGMRKYRRVFRGRARQME